MLKVVHRNQSDNHCNQSLSQTHSCPYHYYIYIYIIQYYSSTKKTPRALPPLSSVHTHNMHSLVVLRFKTVAFVFENQPNKITTDSDQQMIFFCQYNINADFNQYNTRNYQLMRTPTTLQLSQHTSNTVTTKVSLNIFVKHTHTCTRTHTHTCTRTHTHTHNPHAQSHHWQRWKNRRERHEMFVAGATREQKSFEGGLQRLESKK